jgi:hypothetical protein
MITLLRWIARIGGLLALVLGLMLSRVAPSALQIHMTLGIMVALALAILGGLAMAKSVSLPIARMSLIWANPPAAGRQPLDHRSAARPAGHRRDWLCGNAGRRAYAQKFFTYPLAF